MLKEFVLLSFIDIEVLSTVSKNIKLIFTMIKLSKLPCFNFKRN